MLKIKGPKIGTNYLSLWTDLKCGGHWTTGGEHGKLSMKQQLKNEPK